MSKTRGPSKAQTILKDAKMRVRRAREKVTQAQQEVVTATQVLVAYESNYDALEKLPPFCVVCSKEIVSERRGERIYSEYRGRDGECFSCRRQRR